MGFGTLLRPSSNTDDSVEWLRGRDGGFSKIPPAVRALCVQTGVRKQTAFFRSLFLSLLLFLRHNARLRVTVQRGILWYGMVRYSMVWYGMVRYGIVRYGMIWYGTVWYYMARYGLVRYGTVRFGTISYGAA